MPADKTTRYDLSRFINNDNNMHQFNNKLVKSIKSIPEFSNIVVTGLLRLDNISKDLYGSYQLWWILAIYNDILNPMTAKYKGKELSYPSLASIESWYFNNKEEFVLSDLYYSPTPKTNKEKVDKQLKDPRVDEIIPGSGGVIDGGEI